MKRVLLHIGYHKTATSWLQTRLFVREEFGFTRTHSKQKIVVPLLQPRQLSFDAAACRAYFEPALQSAWQGGLLPVLSHERLSGEVHIGGRDAPECARRLQAVFPEAHILIVIREQQSIIRSIYGQYVKGSGVWPLRLYLDAPVAPHTRFKYAHFDPDHFAYHTLIGYYQQLFGRERVTILPYELFRANPTDFTARLLSAVGMAHRADNVSILPFQQKVNPSLSAFGIELKRWLNRLAGPRTQFNTTPLLPGGSHRRNLRLKRLAFLVDSRLPAGWKKDADTRMKQQIAARFKGYYACSNRHTAERTGLDLAQWGYDQ